jgi:hypothetical protein
MDRPYVLGRKPDYISTWFGADGFAGRSLGHEPGFNEQYRLAALVRTDSSELSTDRVLPITDPEPPRSELVALREGKGHVRGRYDWALYERRKPGAYAPLPVTGFRSNLPGWKRSDRLIVAAPKGHVPAHIMWGPFIQLPRGSYGGYVKMELGRVEGLASWQRLCGFEVYDGKRSLTQAQLLVGLPAAPGARKIDFTFEVRPEDESRKIEFRMYCWGLADVTVESVLIAQKP